MKQKLRQKKRMKIYFKSSKQSIPAINNGIQILRMILSFLIVLVHCYDYKKTSDIAKYLSPSAINFYISTFYIISLYLSYKMIILKNIEKMNSRLQRIMIPYIFWPILFFIVNNIRYYNNKNKKYIFKDLFVQFLTGKRIHNVFWFQCYLFLSFIFYIILILLTNKLFIYFMQFFALFGYIYYSFNLDKKLFSTHIFEAKGFFEVFPRFFSLHQLEFQLLQKKIILKIKE